jgi:hypothetical protein
MSFIKNPAFYVPAIVVGLGIVNEMVNRSHSIRAQTIWQAVCGALLKIPLVEGIPAIGGALKAMATPPEPTVAKLVQE